MNYTELLSKHHRIVCDKITNEIFAEYRSIQLLFILHHTSLPKLVRSQINVKMADTEAKRSKYECRCNFHDKWKDFTCENVVLHIERGKVSAAVVNFLREHNFLGPQSSFLCKSCISKTKNIFIKTQQLTIIMMTFHTRKLKIIT